MQYHVTTTDAHKVGYVILLVGYSLLVTHWQVISAEGVWLVQQLDGYRVQQPGILQATQMKQNISCQGHGTQHRSSIACRQV